MFVLPFDTAPQILKKLTPLSCRKVYIKTKPASCKCLINLLLCSQDFQLQQLERRISRMQGERSNEEKLQLEARIKVKLQVCRHLFSLELYKNHVYMLFRLSCWHKRLVSIAIFVVLQFIISYFMKNIKALFFKFCRSWCLKWRSITQLTHFSVLKWRT